MANLDSRIEFVYAISMIWMLLHFRDLETGWIEDTFSCGFNVSQDHQHLDKTTSVTFFYVELDLCRHASLLIVIEAGTCWKSYYHVREIWFLSLLFAER